MIEKMMKGFVNSMLLIVSITFLVGLTQIDIYAEPTSEILLGSLLLIASIIIFCILREVLSD